MTKRFFIIAILTYCLCLYGVGNTHAQEKVRVCLPRDFGAQADGVHKDTKAIQSAIDNCAGTGGGIVRLSSGKYLSEPIFLKSKVTLQIEAGAVLLATQDQSSYKSATSNGFLALVNAVDQTDIAIAGSGKIDGAGEPWWKAARAARKTGNLDLERPRLILFSHCRRVRVEGITLTNSPSFHLVPMFSEDVVIKYVTIKAPPNSPNTDGIVPWSSRHVRISHCKIDTGDDNVAIKSGQLEPTYPQADSADITISDCTFLHGHGVSIGSQTSGGVRNVIVERCKFRGTQNGLRIKSARDRGGSVKNIIYRDIEMENVNPAITFSAYYPVIPKQDTPQAVTATTPLFQDISVTNLVAKGGKTAGIIIGLPEKQLFNIVLKNVKIFAQTGMVVRNATIKTSNVEISHQHGSAFILEEQGNLNSDNI